MKKIDKDSALNILATTFTVAGMVMGLVVGRKEKSDNQKLAKLLEDYNKKN